MDGHQMAEAMPEEATDGEHHRPLKFPEIHSLTRLVTDRGVRSDIYQLFGCKMEFSTTNGEPAAHYYPRYKDGNLVAYKHRDCLNKRGGWTVIRKSKQVDHNSEFFGQNLAREGGSTPNHGRVLIITEGELDAMSVYQAVIDRRKGSKVDGSKPAVVSCPDGAGSLVNIIKKQIDWVTSFDKVVFMTDEDDPGREARDEASKILPFGKSFKVELSKKDANEMLQCGGTEELYQWAEWNFIPIEPEGQVSTKEAREAFWILPKWGLDYPWHWLTQQTYGIRPKEVIGLGAGTGVGKTTVMYEILNCLIDQGQRPGLFLMESTPSDVIHQFVSLRSGLDCFNPDVVDKLDHEVWTPHLDYYDGKYSLANMNVTSWTQIEKLLRKFVLVDGCNQIVLDPLTMMTADYDSSSSNDVLKKIFKYVSQIVRELDITLFWVTHLNLPQNTDASHEEGARVRERHFTESRAMIRYSHYVIGLERNKQSESEKNISRLRILKDRKHGNEGHFQLEYIPETRRMIQI